MMYSWQKKQWDMVLSLIRSDRMPHALLLQGREGIGKHDFAGFLAKSVLCPDTAKQGSACDRCESCRVFEAKTHPDLVRIKPLPPENSKSKTPVLNIKVDAIRELCNTVTRTSQFEGYRVAIIENADHMVINAANSLLKTLEEPGKDVLFILVSSRPARLPVTIRSRCRIIRFEKPETDQAIDWLNSNAVKNSELALRLSRGAPLAARQLDEEQLNQRKLLTSAFTASLNNEISISYAQKLAAIPKQRALDWLFDWVSDLIRIKLSTETTALINAEHEASLVRLAGNIDEKAMFHFYDAINQPRKTIGIALNAELFWENLLIFWDNLRKP